MTEYRIKKIAKRYLDAIAFQTKPSGGMKAKRSRLNKKHFKARSCYMYVYNNGVRPC